MNRKQKNIQIPSERMQALCETHCANKLYLKFNVEVSTNSSYSSCTNNSNKLKISPEYCINDSVLFQVKVQYPKIFIKFMKIHSEDPLNYEIRLSCDQFSIKDKTFKEYDIWHLIYALSNSEYINTYELIVYVEVLPSTNSFASLYNDAELIDFELRGKDGSVQVHKVVLAASSPVFRKMVRGKFREAKQGHVNIEDASRITLQQLKDYVYLHTMPDTGLEELLLLASCYMMPDLEQKCVNKLVANMTARNACELLQFATRYEATRLLLAILEAIQSSTVQVKDMRKYFLSNKSKP